MCHKVVYYIASHKACILIKKSASKQQDAKTSNIWTIYKRHLRILNDDYLSINTVLTLQSGKLLCTVHSRSEFVAIVSIFMDENTVAVIGITAPGKL